MTLTDTTHDVVYRTPTMLENTFQDTINKYAPTYAKRKKELVYHSWSVYFEKEEKQTVEKVLLNPFYKLFIHQLIMNWDASHAVL